MASDAERARTIAEISASLRHQTTYYTSAVCHRGARYGIGLATMSTGPNDECALCALKNEIAGLDTCACCTPPAA